MSYCFKLGLQLILIHCKFTLRDNGLSECFSLVKHCKVDLSLGNQSYSNRALHLEDPFVIMEQPYELVELEDRRSREDCAKPHYI